MKTTPANRFLPTVIAAGFALVAPVSAAELYWDANGDASTTTGNSGTTTTVNTWTNPNTWRDGSATGALGNWVDDSTAVFGGTAGTVQIPSEVRVNQVKTLTHNYNIGAVGAGPIRFTGTYSDEAPTIDSTGILPVANVRNTQVQAKITGTLNGGLVIKDVNDITAIATSGRTYLNALSNSDFVGNITVLSGNLHIFSNLGDPANNIILKGGALYALSGTGTTNYNISRGIQVAADSALGSKCDSGGTQNWNLSGPITGAGNLTRYHANATANVNLQGDMSGYTGTFDNRGGNVSIETTATSGGAWILSGGTLKLNTTNDTHIGNGAGKSNLVVNAGTLEMNGKSETINGLSGGGGVIQNLLADTSSTLTLGDADASATFGGTLRDNFDTNAILALTKTGAGTQVMGNATHNGPTLIATGTLHINGAISASPLTVKGGARLNIGAELPNLESLALEDGAGFQARLDTTEPGNVFVAGDLDFSGGTVTLYPVLSGVPELQTYLFAEAGAINGTATLVADFSANGLSRLAGTAAIVGNTIQLTITQAVADLVWNNAASNGLWNVNDARNFRNGFLNDFFLNGDRVLFDTVSPPGAGAISLQGTLAPSAVEVNSADDFTFAGDGSLTGAMTLIKRGTGTLAIDNTNTFTGPTTVEEGILTVDGTLGTGKVDILPLAILRGTGTVPGAVFIDASAGDAATVAPGAVAGAVGALATGPMTVYGTYRCDIDGAQADRIDITGNLSLSETSAALDVNFVSPSTAVNHPIITYTGTRAGTFDPLTIPAGWEIDYSDSGKVVLWPAATTPPAGMITFEADQGYPDTTDPEADRNIAGVNGSSNDAPFDGTQGWSRSTSTTGGGAGAAIHPTNSSGEYRGGQAIGANNNNSYIGGKLGGIEVTGANTLTFDAPFNSGTQVGFFSDADKDGLFDQSEAGMSWGFQGATIALGYRDAGFGTVYGNFPGTAGHWYRFTITIGGSTGSSRDIVMAVRNLTTGADYDFDAETAGIQPLAHTVTDAQFGVAPERADGIWVRTTSSARIDNLRATSVEPPAGTAYDLWMDGFPELTGDARLPGSDPDNDGTKNLLEFVLNGDPRVSDTDILPQPELMPNGDLKLTFSRRDDSEGLVTLTLQTGTTLDAWDDIVIGAGDGSSGDVSWTVVENGTDPDLITLTLAGNGPKKFARLKAMEVTTP